jgi:methionyl aminopeptidase
MGWFFISLFAKFNRMTVKTSGEIRKMEKACRLAAETLVYGGKLIKPGITTGEIDQIVHEYTLSRGAKPAPLGYHGFPKSTCTSVNDVICHGVPDGTVLKEGDIVNLDITCLLDGYHGDTSATYFVGDVAERARLITEVAKEAMMEGIAAITPNGTTGDIGFAINKYVTRRGYYVVREIGGHGIGTKFHEEPFVPSFGKKGRGDRLLPWGTITVEPMINERSGEIEEFDIPGSTIKYYRTLNQALSAQFEHTVLITDSGYQILTLCD